MNVSSAIARFFEYQKANCKENTVRNYHFFLPKFEAQFGNRELNSLTNPLNTPVLRKLFSHPKPKQWVILEKNVIDEMIFRTENPRNRLILELMARSGMRVSEVLGLNCEDIEDRRASLINPKSGKDFELVYIPKKVSDRLRQYILQKNIKPEERVFPIS